MVEVHARVTTIWAAGFLLLAVHAVAQVQLGDLRMSMSGTVAPGYSATSGNTPGSASHSFTFGGASTLTGSYHSPNFLSFNAGLYLNQSRANSDFQSISNASGIDLSSSIFGGSDYPGSVGYSLAYNSEGNYGIPGLANFVTHGNSSTFSINWSEHVQDVPSFSAGYQMGSSKYSVYGSNDSGNDTFHSVNFHSSYKLAGFDMGGYYTLGGSHALIPAVVTGVTSGETESSTDGYGFNVSHRLPLSGAISGGFNRSSWDSDYAGSSSTGTIDLLGAQAEMHPLEKMSLSAGVNYSDNLAGQLVQQILSGGGVAPVINTSASSNSLDMIGAAGYTPLPELQATFSVESRTQSYSGQTYGVMSYGVSTSYSRESRLGSFNSFVSAIDNSDDQTGNNTLGFSATESYSGEYRDWKINANFSYAQNVQTLLVTYLNSYYNYSANAHKHWGQVKVAAAAAASRTALTDQPGTESDSQSYNGSFGYGRWFNATGSFARAHGVALATGAGLIPVPVPQPVLPTDLLSLYGGHSYSASVASVPIRSLTLSATYSRALSNTSSLGSLSQNETDQFNALMQYQVRKLYFTGGYARLSQGFSGSGVPSQVLVSYYAGVSRWFKFF